MSGAACCAASTRSRRRPTTWRDSSPWRDARSTAAPASSSTASKHLPARERLRQAQALLDLCRGLGVPVDRERRPRARDRHCRGRRPPRAGRRRSPATRAPACPRRSSAFPATTIPAARGGGRGRRRLRRDRQRLPFGHQAACRALADWRRSPRRSGAAPVPVAAIGGITPANAAQAVAAGADMLAVISSLFDAPDVTAAARALSRPFDTDSRIPCTNAASSSLRPRSASSPAG